MSDSFYRVVTAAVREFEENGFDSAERLTYWIERIRKSAEETLTPQAVLERTLRDSLAGVYKRLIEDGKIIQAHPDISRFTLDRLKPKLRAELDRRVMVSRSLVTLNREQMVEKTVQRFAGWASSVPAGGSRAVDVKETKDHIRQALTSMPFTERRLHIDQGHKFTAALNEIIAVGGGAIAVRWNSQWRRAGYGYRVDHKERDQKVYLLRESWAREKGLVKVGSDGYYDDITKVGEEVYCSCFATWVYALKKLPEDMLTANGKKALEAARAKVAAMRQD